MALQNTGLTTAGNKHVSTFIDPVLGRSVTFDAKSSLVKFKSANVDMINVTVRANQPHPVGTPACDPCGTDTVVTSVELRFNMIKGDMSTLDAARVSLNALVDKAIADYQLMYGLVPPASANFADPTGD